MQNLALSQVAVDVIAEQRRAGEEWKAPDRADEHQLGRLPRASAKAEPRDAQGCHAGIEDGDVRGVALNQMGGEPPADRLAADEIGTRNGHCG